MRSTLLLPAHIAVVLHYESCSFARWSRKFCEYAQRQMSGEDQELGFSFYQRSMALCARLLEASAQAKEHPDSHVRAALK